MESYTRAFGFTQRVVVLVLLIVVWQGLFGCAEIAEMRPNVSADDRILFVGKETDQGVFEYGKLSVKYNYNLTGDTLQLTGDIGFSRRFDALNVYLLFIDSAGDVLQQDIVYSSGYRVPQAARPDRSFRETLTVPRGAAGFSFSYSVEPRSQP